MPAPDIAGRLLPATGRMSPNFEQFFDPDRQLADANAKRMVDGIGDGSGRAHVGELADALHAGWIDFAVLLRDEDDFDLVDIGVHGNEIVGQIVVDVARPGFAISVASCSAELMPQIMPPMYWLRAVRVFMRRPAANAPTIRGTRISRVSALMRTSTNSAPNAYMSFSPFGPPVMAT